MVGHLAYSGLDYESKCNNL